MSRWFRWHEGTCEDGKFRVVARNAGVTVATVMGVWAALLEDASHDDHRGRAVRGEDFYAAILDLEQNELQSVLEQMDRANLIACCTNDTIEITRWKERQYETDITDPTNAERQKKWREKHRKNSTVTERNGPVTEAKRPDTDTDTDTEADKKEPRAVALSFDPNEFNIFWADWPNKVGKPAAVKALAAARKRGVPFEAIMLGVHAYIRTKPPDRPWLNPATFLNQDRWEDQPAKVENAKTGNVLQATDNLVSILDSFNRGSGEIDAICGTTGATNVRLLSQGRSQRPGDLRCGDHVASDAIPRGYHHSGDASEQGASRDERLFADREGSL
jgi:hypothetical protein